MFGFVKKEMNTAAAQAFWVWFAEKESWIVDNIDQSNPQADSIAVIEAIDEKLKPVFPYFLKELEFQLGYNQEQGEFFFFHMGNRNLIRDGKTFSAMMPEALRPRWAFLLER